MMPPVDTSPDQSASTSNITSRQAGVLWVHPEVRISLIRDGDTSLGRSEHATIILAGERVSRRHSLIQKKGAHLSLRDEGSRNGTRCNGQLVHETPIAENDVLRVGDWVGVVLHFPESDAPGREAFEQPVPNVLSGPRTRALWDQVRAVAQSSLPVVLEGETGSGKEVVAKAIHRLSQRSGRFAAVNCAALPEGLAEAQLFGHTKGAFTGAEQARDGFFATADKGTLLLDELAELPMTQQAKLLRAVELKAITPVGAATSRPVDVRIVAAAQYPIWRLVELGTFRPDLHARLSGVAIRIPPLRTRREEILPIFNHVVAGSEFANIPQKASFVEALLTHEWPGNVRSLVQAAERAKVLLRSAESLSAKHVRSLLSAGGELRLPDETAPGYAMRASSDVQAATGANELAAQDILGQRRYSWLQRNREFLRPLLAAMEQNRGNVSEAARQIGISRQRAYRLLEVHTEIRTRVDSSRKF